MQNRYAVLGIAVTVLAAAGLVVIGSRSPGGTVPVTSAQSLSPSHPVVTTTAIATPGDGLPDTAGAQVSIKKLESARQQTPHDAQLLLQLGSQYFLAQRYGDAADAFRAVLRLRPGDPTAQTRLAMVWQADGATARARAAILAVLKGSPDDQEAHYSLAIVYFSQNLVGKAKNEWTTAARLDPKTAIGRRSQSFVDLIEGNAAAQGDGGD